MFLDLNPVHLQPWAQHRAVPTEFNEAAMPPPLTNWQTVSQQSHPRGQPQQVRMEITQCCIPVTQSGVRSSHPTIPSPHPLYSCRSEEQNSMSIVWFLTYWRGLVSLNSFSLSEIIWPIVFFSLSFFCFYISIFFLRLCWGVKIFSEQFHFMSELLSSKKLTF